MKKYHVIVNGRRTVLKLNDADARKRGLTERDVAGKPAPVSGKARPAPANKSGAASSKGE